MSKLNKLNTKSTHQIKKLIKKLFKSLSENLRKIKHLPSEQQKLKSELIYIIDLWEDSLKLKIIKKKTKRFHLLSSSSQNLNS